MQKYNWNWNQTEGTKVNIYKHNVKKRYNGNPVMSDIVNAFISSWNELIFNQTVSKISGVRINEVSEKTDWLVLIKRNFNMQNESWISQNSVPIHPWINTIWLQKTVICTAIFVRMTEENIYLHKFEPHWPINYAFIQISNQRDPTEKPMAEWVLFYFQS